LNVSAVLLPPLVTRETSLGFEFRLLMLMKPLKLPR